MPYSDKETTQFTRDEEGNIEYEPAKVAGELGVFQNPFTINYLFVNIQRWGQLRNISTYGGATALSQLTKLQEELDELKQAIVDADQEQVLDAVGDMLVVLVQILRLSKLTLDDALLKAWEDIKDRKGKMIDGVFVKESDLKDQGE